MLKATQFTFISSGTSNAMLIAQKCSLFFAACFPKQAAFLDEVHAKERRILPGANLFSLSLPRCLPRISVCPTLISCANTYNIATISDAFQPKGLLLDKGYNFLNLLPHSCRLISRTTTRAP